MQLKTLLLGLIIVFSPVAVMAGSGHDHGHSHSNAPVDEATAKANATNSVAALVESKKLESSWTSITASSAEKKTLEGNTEWVVVFVNNSIADTDKQTLYVFLTLTGEYIAANHTGK